MLFVGQTLPLKSKLSGRWYVSSFYVSRKNVTTNHSRLSLPRIQSSISHTERRVKSVSCVSDSLKGLKLSSDDRRRADSFGQSCRKQPAGITPALTELKTLTGISVWPMQRSDRCDASGVPC